MKRPTSLPPLVGPAGQTIARREIEAEPRSGPTLTGVRSAVSQFRSTGLSPQRCAAILRRAAEGDWQAFLELAEEMEERDPHYQAVLSVRRRQVAQLPITVEAASDDAAHVEHADFVRRWIKRGILRLALFDILDAIGKGFSVHEVSWISHPKSGVYPGALHYRPARWFAADEVDKDTPLLRGLGQHEPLAEHLYLLHKHPSKSGLTIRSGLAYLACWSWMLKRFSDADWAAFVERYGSPLRVGKYDPASSETDRDVLWRAVANIAGDCAAIIPASMSIEFVDAMKGGGNAELHERRARYLDEQISKVILGQTTTTDAISGGHAVSKEHRKVSEDIERADAILLSATITHRLVPWIVSFNYGPQDDYPAVLIGRPDEIPLKDWIDAVDKMAGKGLRIGQSVVRDRLGIEEPAEDEDLLGTGSAATPPQDPLAGLFARFDAAANGSRKALMSIEENRLEAAMVERLGRAAGPAIAANLATIRAEFAAATSLEDLKVRLDRLQLEPKVFAAAMTEGIFLADLAGRAALLEELERGDA